MNEFLSLVKEQPDWSLTKKHICPYCSNTERIDASGWSQTDMSHNNLFWAHCSCRACGEHFTHFYKEGVREVHWYTETRPYRSDTKNKVLLGIPAGVSGLNYLWTCQECGGDVQCLSPVGSAVLWIPNQIKEFQFICLHCGEKVVSPNDSYRPEPLPTETRDFGGALQWLHEGKTVARLTWGVIMDGPRAVKLAALGHFLIAGDSQQFQEWTRLPQEDVLARDWCLVREPVEPAGPFFCSESDGICVVNPQGVSKND